MIIIKNAHIYAPADLGIQDILIGGNKILDIAKDINYPHAHLIDAKDMIITPGLIDQHIHVTGGGGENGFSSKAFEVDNDKLIAGGITTLVGLLGTDGYSRNIPNLVSKLKALKAQGFSAFGLCGSYSYPSITLTNSVTNDILFIDEIIGCKIALSDHRSSHLNYDQFIQLASEVRVAGMLANKAGILTIHMGDEETGLELINKALTKTQLPINLFHPTHVNRNPALFKQAIAFNKQGGWIDLTCGDEPIINDYRTLIKEDANLARVTFSSDGQGSYSQYDQDGNCIGFGISSVDALYQELKAMVLTYDIPLTQALCPMTINVVNALKLANKGTIAIDKDADLLLLDKQLNIHKVMAQGKWLK
ncbi:MAG: beta-aspartyl-peptidase [Erysipelotrichaceae bacterium]|nr:beta-aspartyl-peptidase [Erysipelotrichaceae bacterium]MDY5251242.1 beta-aspartyl-peptidase [Erysipelotrichaceae bacterium]